MAQFSRPDADVQQNGWTLNGGPSTVFECIDGVSASDSDYIEADTTSDGIAEVDISTVTDPVSNINHTVRVRMQNTGGGGAPERIDVHLYEGGTLRATPFANFATADAFNTETYTLTTGEADSITSYSTLRLRFTPTALGGGETIQVSWAEFEVPDVSGGTILPQMMQHNYG